MRRPLTLLTLLVAAAAGSVSCQPQLPPTLEHKPAVVFTTVNGKDLHLELLYPKEPPIVPMPVVVWVHGGAWRAGGYQATGLMQGLAQQGYFCASLEYRFSQEAIFPAQIHDCKAGLRYLRAHAAEYRLNPDKIGVWGGSAGGHLVALLGTSGGVKELEGEEGNLDQSSRVQCVVDLFGPADMATMISDRGNQIMLENGLGPEESLIGGKLEDHLDVAKAASPVTYIDKTDPPFLILHGEQDKTVAIAQSEKLDRMLREAGVASTLVRVKNAGHGFGPGCEPTQQQLMQMALEFFNKHLK